MRQMVFVGLVCLVLGVAIGNCPESSADARPGCAAREFVSQRYNSGVASGSEQATQPQPAAANKLLCGSGFRTGILLAAIASLRAGSTLDRGAARTSAAR